jgi:hypothetical protein
MDNITIPKSEFEQMKKKLEVLRDSKVYKRLLKFEQNISKKKYSRKDLGF